MKLTRFKPTYLIVGSLLIIVGVSFAVGRSYFATKEQLVEVPTVPLNQSNLTPTTSLQSLPTPQPSVVDEVKDGVYTNYTYGFRFEYDDKLFKEHNPWDKYWKSFFPVRTGGMAQHEIRVIVNSSTNHNIAFDKCDQITKNSFEFFECFVNPAMKNDGSESGGYVSPNFSRAFKKNENSDQIVVSVLYTADSENIYRPVFDQIISTFEFFK